MTRLIYGITSAFSMIAFALTGLAENTNDFGPFVDPDG